eukprot:TRINITY_DN6836_c0_g1_i1.p1 TRINITY_DN6836_c0_g1~~TRINITY_DN6836_c0_g1_i1.p1  ORF type:complete len:697 (+),score=173.46 TRINITY_DN6836_c0_g1_i1:115-2205(+)
METPSGLHVSFFHYFLEHICPDADVTADATTKDVCNQVILPMTQGKKCAFIDLMSDLRTKAEADGHVEPSSPHWVAPATVFISHAWKYKYSAPLQVAIDYADAEDANAYFWFDLFINNQNGFEVTHSFEWLCGRFKDSIRAIGTVVLVLSPWNDPIPLTRSWCLWELVSTAELEKENVQFHVRLPKDEQAKFESIIRENAYAAYDSLLGIDARRAEASVDSDRAMIAEAIERTVGYAAVNAMVKDQMSRWIVATCYSLLEAEGDKESFEYAALAYQINQVLAAVSSDTAKRLELMTNALCVFEQHFEPTSQYIIACHQLLGGIYTDLDDVAQAEIMLTKALTSARNSSECAIVMQVDMLLDLCRLNHRTGDYSKLVERAKEAIAIATEELGADHPKIAEIKMTLAVAYHEQGKFAQGYDLFIDVERALIEVHGEINPVVSITQDNMAWALFELERPAEALNYAEKGLEARRSALGNNHSDTTFSRITRSQCLVALGRHQDAIDELTKAEPYAENSFNLGYLHHVWGQAVLGLGKADDAREQLEKALHHRNEAGSKADEAGRTLIWLSKACQAQDDHSKAVDYAQQAVDMLVKGLGEEHPDTKKARAWQSELTAAEAARAKQIDAPSTQPGPLEVKSLPPSVVNDATAENDKQPDAIEENKDVEASKAGVAALDGDEPSNIPVSERSSGSHGCCVLS